MGYYGYGPMFGDWGGHGFGFGFIIMLLGVVFLIALIVGLVRLLSGPGGQAGNPRRHLETTRQARRDEALHILEKRFAQGEIDEEEFQRRRQVLKEQD